MSVQLPGIPAQLPGIPAQRQQHRGREPAAEQSPCMVETDDSFDKSLYRLLHRALLPVSRDKKGERLPRQTGLALAHQRHARQRPLVLQPCCNEKQTRPKTSRPSTASPSPPGFASTPGQQSESTLIPLSLLYPRSPRDSPVTTHVARLSSSSVPTARHQQAKASSNLHGYPAGGTAATHQSVPFLHHLWVPKTQIESGITRVRMLISRLSRSRIAPFRFVRQQPDLFHPA